MNVLVSLGWVVFVVLLVGIIALIVSAIRASKESNDVDTRAPFNLRRYAPLEQLRCGGGLAFLSELPGYRSEIGDRLRREYRVVIREYIDELRCDFGEIHRQARRASTHSGPEAAALVEKIFRQHFIFEWLILRLRVQLALESVGIGHVDLQPVINLLETMRLDLDRAMQPAS